MDDMNYNDYISLILGPNSKLSEALQVLNATGQQIILVCSDQRKLVGTVTDGDIRRALLKLNWEVSQYRIIQTSPSTIDIQFTGTQEQKDQIQFKIKELLTEYGVKQINFTHREYPKLKGSDKLRRIINSST